MANYPVYSQNPNYWYYPVSQSSQQSFAQSPKNIEWVEGEVGARAFQMPNGWTPNTPVSLWDSTQNRIYFKSWNQVGMANPLLYTDYPDVKELKSINALPEGNSGDMHAEYVTKKDLEELRQEIKNMSSAMSNNQNMTSGNQSMMNNQGNRNRGGQQ